eukprot:gnl/TRDRNA2_/TRDRNA2_187795_c0_seq1.p1 gnl/TRDRNA2_/TRDRNA2_187795_c0~~gnl/TRDRNA2_/TRDRNA2_187795_c0_seq1.p1  ORF type:complete len:252 (+),score=52.47 gnl/TRDRNA2_/TRDRNA2_187795_c0_seq1:131-886(+)
MQIAAGSQRSAPRAAATAWYDEFAFGWNEIFDADPWSGPGLGSKAQPAGASSQNAGAGGAPVAAGDRASTGGSSMAAHGPRVLTSKKPPEYLKIGRSDGTKGGAAMNAMALEKDMKDRMLEVPAHELRKPSNVVELELNVLRAKLTEDHRDRRKMARSARRLQRRCQVKRHEDLEELEKRYGDTEFLQLLPDPADREGATSSAPSKDFFEDLHRRREKAAATGRSVTPVFADAHLPRVGAPPRMKDRQVAH